MDDKIYKVTQLADVTRRLILQVKDYNEDIISLNSRLQGILRLMEKKDGVLLLADEEGKQFIGLLEVLDLDTENGKEKEEEDEDLDEDEEWSDVELELDDVVETWGKYNEVFGDLLTDVAKELMNDWEELTKAMEVNFELMQKIQENIKELIDVMRDQFGQDITISNEAMNATLINIQNGIDNGQKCLEDLKTIRSIFPVHDLLTPEEYDNLQQEQYQENLSQDIDDSGILCEESRPFPDAWN